MDWHRVLRALLNHTFKFALGEECDKETGMLHTAHAACCALFLVSYQLRSIGNDDRNHIADDLEDFLKTVDNVMVPRKEKEDANNGDPTT